MVDFLVTVDFFDLDFLLGLELRIAGVLISGASEFFLTSN